jgi:hypothetical protein
MISKGSGKAEAILMMLKFSMVPNRMRELTVE